MIKAGSDPSAPVPHSDALPALNVLHVIASMAAEQGGPPVVCAGLADGLAARGHKVTIATLDEPSLTAVAVDPRVTVERFTPDKPDRNRYAGSAALNIWLAANIQRFDCVHLHSIWLFPTYAAARACWRHKIPYVSLLNGMLDQYSVNQNSRHLKRAYWLWRERHVEERSAGIHCLNRAEIRRAVPWIQEMPKFILGNGIDESALAAMPPRGRFRASRPEIGNRPLALFLSRIHPKKGLDRLIPVWKVVAEKSPDSLLVVAGTGDAPYVDSLKQLVATHQLQNHIHFAGQLTGMAKWEALVDADLFVLPSHQEGFSMAITEALAAGCVPVVTSECNFDELESAGKPSSGIIIQNGDMNQFCNAILSLFTDAPRRQSLAAAGKQLVANNYTWQRVAADLESIYRHIIKGGTFTPDGIFKSL